mmetsp:Transcript_120534/g.236921  ORF Transcript_120534/g.236921 Transcript_120534/m.236921 type:complete len:218 (-) Transcript_120534:8-661(-)
MNLLMASGEAPIIVLFQALQASLDLERSFCDCNSRTRAIMTFDGFCTSPVSGRAMILRWLSGLNRRILPDASSLMRFSSRNRSTSSMRTGSRRRLVLRPLPSLLPADREHCEELSASLACFRFFRFLRSPSSSKPAMGIPIMEGMPIGGTPMDGMPVGIMPMGLAAIMPIIIPICSGFVSPPEPIGHSLVRCGPAHVAQIHFESEEAAPRRAPSPRS